LDKKEYYQQQLEIRKAYRRLFKTPDGKVVLDDLRARFYDRSLDSESANKMAVNVGSHKVVQHIINADKE